MRACPKKTTTKLLKAAAAASEKAYAPYSGLKVGAALLAADGSIFTGCNVENASYGLTICAERCAICAAAAAGIKTFHALAIMASGPALPYPCGACRQVLREFCGPDFPVHMAIFASPMRAETVALGRLLPHPFALVRP